MMSIRLLMLRCELRGLLKALLRLSQNWHSYGPHESHSHLLLSIPDREDNISESSLLSLKRLPYLYHSPFSFQTPAVC
jgi:hypothetical protein